MEQGQAIWATVFGQTDVGLVRTNNEDSFVVADLSVEHPKVQPLALSDKVVQHEVGKRGVLLAVSDGMGGAEAGEVASRLVIESLRCGMSLDEATLSGRRTGEFIQTAVQNANRDVWEAAAHGPGHKGMGATLTAVFLQGPTAYIAEVGDSRAYLLRGGQIRQVTHDQSYVQLLMDSGFLTPDEAEGSPYKNVILQAMGQQPQVVVALGRLELRQEDRFLLCTDGLWGKVQDAEMLAMINAVYPNLDTACHNLVHLAKQRGGDDNITVVLAQVSGEGLPGWVEGERLSQTFQSLQEFHPPARKH